MDGAAPIGPVLVSPEAILDPHRLGIVASHNSKIVQDTNTRYDCGCSGLNLAIV